MQDWLKDDLSTTWAETQKHFMESLYTVLPPPQAPVGIGWWQEAYLKQLAHWEATVKQTLQAESSLIERLAGQASGETEGAPPALSFWAGHTQNLLRQWMSIQHQLWDEFFSLLRGGAAALGEPTVEADLKGSGEPGSAETAPGASSRPAAAAPPSQATAGAATAPPLSSPRPSEPDDLKLIAGIGSATEKKLQAAGIVSYRQLATLDDETIKRIETTVIKWPGRIHRDRWIEQAKALHSQKYRENL